MIHIRPSILDKNTLRTLRGYLFAALIAAATYRLFVGYHWPHLKQLLDASQGVLEGKPHWLTYQNRLLGPYLELMISKFGMHRGDAWKVYNFIFLTLESLLLFGLLKKEGRTTSQSLHAIVIFFFCFIVLQHYWFYAWDALDLVLFTLFAFGILQRQKTSYFIVLFIVAIFNRESALFIALFLIVDAFSLSVRPLSIKLVNYAKLGLGAVLIFAGMAYIKAIRHALFISKPDGNPDTEHETIGNHFQLWQNLEDFCTNFSNAQFVISIALVGSIYYFAKHIRTYTESELKCFIMMMALIANIMLFGLINETRMHFILLPFALFLWLRIEGRATPGAQR